MKKIFLKIFLYLLTLGTFLAMTNSRAIIGGTAYEETSGYEVGDTATDFSLKNVDGTMVSLADTKNAKGYIVTFTCNTCPFAVLYEDRLIALHRKYAPMGYPVIAINANAPSAQAGNSYADMQQRAKEKDFPFVYLVDEGQKIYPQYGASRTPHVFVLDAKMVVRYIGAIDDNSNSPGDVKIPYVANAIDALENGEQPDPSFTKAVGCPIASSAGPVGRGEGPRSGERRQPPSPVKLLEDLDQNKDQKISKAEAKGPLLERFDLFDKDKDGFLSRDELSQIRPPKRGD